MNQTTKEKTLSPKQLYDRQPDPLAPRANEVEGYVAAVQARFVAVKDGRDRKRLRREVLNQIELAGIRAVKRRTEALDSLDRIFRLGSPPTTPLDGFYRGIFVTPALGRNIDRVLRAATRAYLPWVGKRFNAAEAEGVNLLDRSGRVMVRLAWPGYDKLRTNDDGALEGFRFNTYGGPGRLDPDRQSLALDYSTNENPKLVVRSVLDELVEIVPGVYLGKMLYRIGGNWRLVAYFAVTDAPSPDE